MLFQSTINLTTCFYFYINNPLRISLSRYAFTKYSRINEWMIFLHTSNHNICHFKQNKRNGAFEVSRKETQFEIRPILNDGIKCRRVNHVERNTAMKYYRDYEATV